MKRIGNVTSRGVTRAFLSPFGNLWSKIEEKTEFFIYLQNKNNFHDNIKVNLRSLKGEV